MKLPRRTALLAAAAAIVPMLPVARSAGGLIGTAEAAAQNPCAPGNPCAPANPCAPGNPCAPAPMNGKKKPQNPCAPS